MRVVSIQQPFAQLVVRGVKRLDVRGWDTAFRGRVAVHASTAKPSKRDAANWFDEEETAMRFADQGWLDRNDLKALPYGAIVGTVDLTDVQLGKDVVSGDVGAFAWNLSTDRMEIGEADRATGALVEKKRRVKPLGVAIPKGAHVWVYANPVEFEPITDVDGKQRLWHLVGELEHVIAERERRARKGLWKPLAVSPSKRAKAGRAWRQRWNAERERLFDDIEASVKRQRAIEDTRFTIEVESQIRDDMTAYLRGRRTNSASSSAPMTKVEPHLRPLVGGREVAPVEDLELALRLRLKRQGERQHAARRRERRKEEFFRIIDAAEEEARARHVAIEGLRPRLMRAMERMLEEEAEDVEFARRERNPLSHERMRRAEERNRRFEAELAAHRKGEAKVERRRRSLIEEVLPRALAGKLKTRHMEMLASLSTDELDFAIESGLLGWMLER